jgi:transposase
VIRKKINQKIERLREHRNPTGTGVIKDEKIIFSSKKGMKEYPEELRMVTYIDPETHCIYEFLTDECRLSALNIAGIYKARWQVEIFFKWIKQNLKIKTFFGTSENAVKTQVWIAMIYYLLLKWLSACINPKRSPTDLTSVLSTVVLHFLPLFEVISCKVEALDMLVHAREGPQLRMW